jgi:SAM-dependent methyltransferase
MIINANKEELQKITQRLAYVCRYYTQHISVAANVDRVTYPLPDGVRGFGFIASCNYDELIYKFTKLYTIIRAKDDYINGHIKFLDIGCGIGNIVLLASVSGFYADGLEYNRDTYKVAKQVCKYNMKVFHGDMRKFRHYKEYDVLYYYQPISDGEEMEKFSFKLSREMKPGAYVITNGSNEGFKRSKEFEPMNNIGRSVWQKKEK